jgi:hypothetical protein
MNNQPDDRIYRDELTGKCWIETLREEGVVILRRGNLTETHDEDGFDERFTEVG